MRKNLYIASLTLLILIFSISFVSASEIDSNDAQIGDNSIDYYVDLGGDDNNMGYENSPFYSINKAIAESKPSDNVNIHLCEGTFKGENNTMITINKAHLNRGGSITIHGAGADKTFIDGSFAYYIFDIKSDSVVTLSDLSIINCKSITGGAITNMGSLSILNSGFNNNHAINKGGAVYSTDSASLIVKDSMFINNTAKQGGAIYTQKSDLSVDSSKFVENHVETDTLLDANGGALCIGSYIRNVPSVVNSIFINNSAISKYPHHAYEYTSGGSIYMQRCNLNNISFINSKVEDVYYHDAKGGSYYFDSTKYLNTLTNILRINSSVDGVLEQDIYPSDINSSNIIFISPKGNDITGDGSKNKPYATIAHGIELNNGKVNNLEINLLHGIYKGEGNTNLDLPGSMNIKIIGLNSTFDGENNNTLLRTTQFINSGKYELINLTITNFKGQSNGYEKEDNIGIIHTYANMLVNNCIFTNNNGSIITNFDGSNLIINNSLFEKNYGRILYNFDSYSKIINSIINNTEINNKCAIIESHQNSLDDSELSIVNSCILNSKGLGGYTLELGGVKCNIVNSLVANSLTENDIVSYYESPVNIINSSFINGGGFKNEIKWNVSMGNFIGNRDLLFKCSNSFKNVFNTILISDNKKSVKFDGNAIKMFNSGIYDNIIFNVANTNNIDLNHNYWNGLNPSELIKSNYDVLPTLWIVKSISASNLYNGSFNVKLNYKLNNNRDYDVSNTPIGECKFVLNYDFNSISGVLNKSGFEYICDVGENDLDAEVIFEDNTVLSIYVQNIHESKSIIDLSTNSCDLGDNLDISIGVVDVKTNKLISEGNLNLYLNDELIAIYTLTGDTLTKSIKVNGTKCLNNISVKYLGNSDFTDSNDSKIFLIKSIPLDTELTGNNLVKYYKNGSRFEVLLKDVLGNCLDGKDVEIVINGMSYARQTNKQGVASIAINLNPGEYDVISKFNGDNSYNGSAIIHNNISVLSTLNGNNLTKYYLNASQYYVQVLDGLGNPIKNRNVTMNIHGVFYTRLTNDEGFARLNINLDPGTYILTAYHPDTGLSYSNTINVLSRIKTTNIGMFYKDGTGFDAVLCDETGNMLVNTDVTFNIHGVFYTRTSDSSGIAHLNINLLPGTYIITSYLGKNIISNTIHIDPMPVMITLSNVNIERGNYYQVKFNDAKGKPIVSQDAAIKVNDKINIVKTDGEGIASLKMDYAPGIYHVESGLIADVYESKSIYADIRVMG